MKIEHLAIWVKDLEGMKHFYETYFGAVAGELYVNSKKKFSSYFLSFETGCRLELMHNPNIPKRECPNDGEYLGLAHFAISVGSKQTVDGLTNRLANDGFTIVGPPRTTGDGYYESVVLDPDGNRIEITI